MLLACWKHDNCDILNARLWPHGKKDNSSSGFQYAINVEDKAWKTLLQRTCKTFVLILHSLIEIKLPSASNYASVVQH